MADIKLDTQDGLSFDITMDKNDLALDDTLKRAIIISLFTDRRVTIDELPVGSRSEAVDAHGENDRRGWWGDALNDDNDLIGSKLWTLNREKITQEVLGRAKRYCEEALLWLTDDQIAESVTVFVERSGLTQLSIGIEIKRPQSEGDRIKYRFGFIWDGV